MGLETQQLNYNVNLEWGPQLNELTFAAGMGWPYPYFLVPYLHSCLWCVGSLLPLRQNGTVVKKVAPRVRRSGSGTWPCLPAMYGLGQVDFEVLVPQSSHG